MTTKMQSNTELDSRPERREREKGTVGKNFNRICGLNNSVTAMLIFWFGTLIITQERALAGGKYTAKLKE